MNCIQGKGQTSFRTIISNIRKKILRMIICFTCLDCHKEMFLFLLLVCSHLRSLIHFELLLKFVCFELLPLTTSNFLPVFWPLYLVSFNLKKNNLALHSSRKILNDLSSDAPGVPRIEEEKSEEETSAPAITTVTVPTPIYQTSSGQYSE